MDARPYRQGRGCGDTPTALSIFVWGVPPLTVHRPRRIQWVPATLQLSQQAEATHQSSESNQREKDAAITVQVAVKKPHVDPCGKEPKRHNANRVSEHRNRNGQEGQADLDSQGTEEQVADQKTGDEQSTSGMNGAALFGDLDVDNREPEVDPVPEHRHAGQLEQRMSSLGSPPLQGGDDPFHPIERNRHQQQKQQKREPEAARIAETRRSRAQMPPPKTSRMDTTRIDSR